MKFRLLLPSSLAKVFFPPAPIDVVAPPERPEPEWTNELKRMHGVNQIINTTREDVQRQARILRPEQHGYAFTFKRTR